MGVPMYLFGLALPLIGGIMLGVMIGKLMSANENEHQYTNTSYTNAGSRAWTNSPQRKRTSSRKKSYNNLDDDCPICLLEMNEDTSENLDCGHRFHSKCLVNLLKREDVNKSCPICRENITA